MNPKANKYIRDLHSYLENIPYGTINIKVVRKDRKTHLIETEAEETLRYVDTEEALKDLDAFMRNLITTGFTSDAHVKLQMKNGQITLVGIYNKKETKYQG